MFLSHPNERRERTMNRTQRQPAFRPCVEPLEDRTCPTCTVNLIGTTLAVTGDAADNEIRFLYFAPGDLSVECDGTQTQIHSFVERVIVRGGGGDDFVDAELYPFAFDADFPTAWQFDLGTGDDECAVHLLGFSGVDFPVRVTVDGGNGDDSIFTETIGFFYDRYDLSVDGGNGNDSIFDFYSGGTGGHMVTRTQGGNGDDAILEEFASWTVLGRFDGLAEGGNGTDLVEATLGEYVLIDFALPPAVIGLDVAAGARVDYQLTGGNDHDAIFATYVGRLDGQLDIQVEGGNGADEVAASFDLNAESTGQFAARIRGDNGDDHLEVLVRFIETVPIEMPDFPGLFLDGLAGYTDTPAPLSELAVTADGGNGFDTCLHTGLVDLLHIEDDQPS
jgi:hypothetical protein